jgi:hypothetical protein
MDALAVEVFGLISLFFAYSEGRSDICLSLLEPERVLIQHAGYRWRKARRGVVFPEKPFRARRKLIC